MTEIIANGVNEAFTQALTTLYRSNDIRESRNGPVLAFHDPVMTTYINPMERVLFSPMRDANPFFHLIEAMWMLGGRNTVAELSPIVKQIAEYSDDGVILHGAYGYRWRTAFGFDQLDVIAEEIKKDPTTRRAVLAMWDADMLSADDLNTAFRSGKDVPCNTHVYFDARDGRLNMTVCCRSNDLLWGCYGANVVHFGFLLEYMAAATGLKMGVYRQFSNDLHVYGKQLGPNQFLEMADDARRHNWYRDGIGYQTLIDEGESVGDLREDIDLFFDCKTEFDTAQYETAFFNFTIVPAMLAWRGWKYKHVSEQGVMEFVRRIQAPDWKIACKEWLQRRYAMKAVLR